MPRRVIGDVSHEPRTPLTAIKGSMDLDVSTLVQTVTKRLALQAESKRITLDLGLPPDPPPIRADEDRAIQVLTNLTGNALQYTPEGGNGHLWAE